MQLREAVSLPGLPVEHARSQLVVRGDFLHVETFHGASKWGLVALSHIHGVQESVQQVPELSFLR
eukprot:904443-Heterocapsa_arctica.AAC.1